MRLILGSAHILAFLSCYVIPQCATDSSLFMSSILDDFFNHEFLSTPPQKLDKLETIDYEATDPVTPRNKGVDMTDHPNRRRVIRRRVLKILATTEEEEFDCQQRGGTPCTKDSECCLGKCSPFGRCPTAQELFDAAAITLKKERDKKNAQKRKYPARPSSKL